MTQATGINDPYETENRAIHNFNKGVDQKIVRPLTNGLSTGEGPGVFTPVRRSAVNLGDTLETPGRIVNNVLQGRIENAGHNSFRLAVNLLVGVGGIFDPASSMGLGPRDTDFGETLHVWGAGEGAFVEVPFKGPSTERDLIGDIVDAALNPVGRIIPSEANAPASVIQLGAKLAERAEFGSTVDEILYDSADSYAQTRLIYLQNRRFELARNARGAGGFDALDASLDPYDDGTAPLALDDPYASGPSVSGPSAPAPTAPGSDPALFDPYGDPYAP